MKEMKRISLLVVVLVTCVGCESIPIGLRQPAARLEKIIASGNVQHPGRIMLSDGMTLRDALGEARALETSNHDDDFVAIRRRVQGIELVRYIPKRLLQESILDSLRLQEGDEVIVTDWRKTSLVGKEISPGDQYTVSGESLSPRVVTADRATKIKNVPPENTYGEFVVLSRRSRLDLLRIDQFLLPLGGDHGVNKSELGDQSVLVGDSYYYADARNIPIFVEAAVGRVSTQ